MQVGADQTAATDPPCGGSGLGSSGQACRGWRAEPEVVEGCLSPLPAPPRPSPSLYSHILQGKHTLLPSC